MSASWPNSVKNFLTLQDGVDNVIAAHPNDRAAEITAIETWLMANGGAKDCIVRGFELVWKSTTTIDVNPGTLYHGITVVNKTTVTTLNITTAGNYVTGVSQRGTSKWLYIYVDSSGNIKLDATAPNKADAAGNTDGTKYYYYYTAGTTYYRCIGAIRLNATGSGEVEPFYQSGNQINYDNVWNNTIVRVLNAGGQTSFTPIDCSSAVPAISTLCSILFDQSNDATFYLRPGNSLATTGLYFNVGNGTSPKDEIIDLPMSLAQTIEYKVSAYTVTVYIKGYKLNIR